MCGIAGWFSRAPVPESDAPRLRAMLAAIRHRGPDGDGSRIDGCAALGMTRLAIIDPEGGDQPISDAEDRVHVIQNGEIYNYRALREELIARGHRFRTESDTEVILNLYLESGTAGFARLRGMFAIAIWDGRQQTGWLARDPIGIKPLFLAEDADGGLRFGSETKALLARDGATGALDEASLHLLMNFRYVPGDATLFRGVRQLPPGGLLEWRPGLPPRETRIEPALPAPEGDVLDGLEESVAAHLTADVEVGTYLSGGMDSAAIAAFAVRTAGRGLRSFTLAVGDDPDEARNAARTAEILGIENFADPSRGFAADALRRLIWHLELPKINAFQVGELARHASGHVKVVLSGLGGDELFYGYNLHRWLHLGERTRRRLPGGLRAPLSGLGAALGRHIGGPFWTEPERAARVLGALGDWPRVYGLLRNVWDSPALRRTLYGPRMLDAELPDAFEWLDGAWPADPDPVAAAAAFEWRHKMVNDLLWQEDRASMAVGLEVRVPFLDARFSPSVQRLGRERLMPGGRRKAYLAEQLARVLPPEVLERRKSGFQVDSPTFFARHLAPLADEVLSEERVRDAGLFNPDTVARVRRAGTGKPLRWHYFILYLMLTTHLWLEHFESPGGRA